MNELSVVIEQKNGIIDFSNFEEIKEQLSAYLEEYRGASFTEESKGFAKTVVADLRKLKKNVNDRKIEVKKQFIQPYEEFEIKTKELLSLIDEPILLIDNQIKGFEQRRIEERKQLIQEVYDSVVGELAPYASLSHIYSAKWENASTSKKKIEEEMGQIFLGIQMDIESLKLMRVEPDVIQFALDKYKKGESAIESMRKANEFAELMERRKKAEEDDARRRAEEDVVKKKTEEESVISELIPEPEPVQDLEQGFTWDPTWDSVSVPVPEPETGFDLPFVTPSTRRVAYCIVASDSEILDLEMYMNSVGISFERMG